MKASTHALPNVSMKTKRFPFVAGFVTLMALSAQVQAQNVSYNLNSVPIGGGQSVALGSAALTSNSGTANTGIGFRALNANAGGGYNAAVGGYSLAFNVSGMYNSALGYQSLYSNTGSNNTSVGFRSMYINSSGADNTAIGFAALYTNSTGSYNVANGFQSLYSNNSVNNTAIGYNSLYANTSGRDNYAGGYQSMMNNTTGGYNAAVGSYSMHFNVAGQYNAALGYQALYGTTASNNTSVGFRSLYLSTSGPNNTAVGFAALYNNSTGGSNTALGYSADVAANNLDNATAIGNSAVVNQSDKIRFGNATVTVVEGPVAYTFSDGRFKTNITEEVKGLEFINKLRPVVYNLDTRKITESWTKNMPEEQRKQHMSQDFTASTKIRQTGFIAQEVEQAAKDVNYDFNGVHVPANDNDNYSIAYAEFVVPLVKGMQEQQKMIEDQQKVIDQLQQQLSELQKVQGGTTSLEQNFMSDASIEQNVPNPFSHETVIRFTLPAQVNSAFLTVYDLQGKQVKTMPIKDRGNSSVTFTADQLAAGMYIYSIIADGKIVGSKRMVIADR
jgi:hypothetical protein